MNNDDNKRTAVEMVFAKAKSGTQMGAADDAKAMDRRTGTPLPVTRSGPPRPVR